MEAQEAQGQGQAVEYVTLPSLKDTGTRFSSVPRRYEETRPVVIQGSAHHKILYLGQEINENLRKSQTRDRENALRSTAESVWAEAQAIKQEELKKALKKAHSDHEKAIKKMQRAHEKAIRETALRVEGEMQNLVLERVQQEREDGEVRQQQAIHQVELQCQQELIVAVQRARQEERQEAINKAARVAQMNREKLDAALNDAAAEKAHALQQLKAEMLREKESAIQCARSEEKKEAKERLQHLTGLYEQQIEVLKTHLLDHKKEISRLEKQRDRISDQKSNVEAELLETREEFQKFIGSVKPFSEGETDFLIPPLQSFEPV